MSRPPRHPKPLAGQTWFVQRTKGNPLLTAQVEEATQRTVVIRWVTDGSVSPKDNAQVLRWLVRDFKWVEQVPA